METNSVAFFQTQNYPDLSHKPIVAVWKIKNPGNVGNLMRLVDNVGGDSLFLLDNENIKREASIKKIAGLSYSNVNLIYKKSAEFFTSIQEDYTIVAIETSEQSTNIFTTPLPGKVVFLIGSEAHGLPADLIQLCDRCVHIPMTGKCKSMNISHATAVGLFEWLRQQLFFR